MPHDCQDRENSVEVLILAEENVPLPVYSSEGASGADVRANLKETLILEPGSSLLIPTGLKLEIPFGYEIQVRPRSGLALKYQISVLNTPGTIDSDYRGELKILLVNHGQKPFPIEDKMRIAQLVVSPVVQAKFVLKEELQETRRGVGGFGHTGFH